MALYLLPSSFAPRVQWWSHLGDWSPKEKPRKCAGLLDRDQGEGLGGLRPLSPAASRPSCAAALRLQPCHHRMTAIDDLVRQGLDGALRDETQVVYVSPLKALSNDIRQNLDAPLSGIRAALGEECL